MANPNRPTHPRGLTALNLSVLRAIEARMPEGGDRVGGAPAIPQPALSRRERYHARRLAARGRLRRVETDAPWFARRTVLYGSASEPPPGMPPEAEPLAHEPLAHEPLAHEPLAHEPLAHEPLAHEPLAHEPLAHEPLAHEPLAGGPPSVVREPSTVASRSEARVAYRDALFSGVPLYATRLVRERTFTFPTRDQVRSPADVAVVLRAYFEDRDREEFLVLFLDTASSLTGIHVASVGGLAASIVEPRQVFKAAVLANAAAIIVAHQHPSGNPEPSREDVAVTRQLVEAGEVMGIPVHDHLIVTDHGHTSLAERGLI